MPIDWKYFQLTAIELLDSCTFWSRIIAEKETVHVHAINVALVKSANSVSKIMMLPGIRIFCQLAQPYNVNELLLCFFLCLLFFCWQCRFLFLVWDSIYIHHFFSFGWCIRWLNNGWTSIFRRYSMNDLLNELETFVKTVNKYQQSPNWGADIWTWLMRLMKSKWSKHFELFSTNSAFSFFQVMLVGADKYNYSWNSRQNTVNQLWLSLSLSLSVSWCIWFWILISTPLLQYPVL